VTCGAAKHGTAYAWRWHECRCPEAVQAHYRQGKEYRKKVYLNGGENLRVPNVGALRRKQALAFMGWTEEEVGRQMGVPQPPRPRQRGRIRNVNPATHQWWVEAFEALAMKDGPSTRARSTAITKGWAGPLAWLDIDDPDEVPGLSSDILRETSRRWSHAAKRRRAQRARRLRQAGYPVPRKGTIPTVTQYERELEKKAAYAVRKRAEAKEARDAMRTRETTQEAA